MVLDLDNLSCKSAHKLLIVAHQKYCARKRDKRMFKDAYTIDIQVVCRLIKEKQRIWRYEHFCKGKAGLFAAGENRHLFVHIVTVKKKRTQKLAQGLRCPGTIRLDHLIDHAIRFSKLLELMLSIITCFDVEAMLNRACARSFKPIDEFEERRFTGTIRTNDSHMIAAVERKIHIAIHRLVLIGFRHMMQRYNQITRAWRLRKVKMHLFCRFGENDELTFYLFKTANTLLYLLRLGRFIAKTIDKYFDVLDFFLLRTALSHEL